uniref:Uncharacterized protein n=1 Tax=Arundo donax TaxID=35708 RepID=A0A0A9S3Y5_ARUDO
MEELEWNSSSHHSNIV